MPRSQTSWCLEAQIKTWTAAAMHPPLSYFQDAFLKGLCDVGACSLETLSPASCRHSLNSKFSVNFTIHWLFPVFCEQVKGSCAGHRFKILERKQGGPYVPILCWTCCKGWQWFPASATVWRTAGPWELILLGLAVPGDKKTVAPTI